MRVALVLLLAETAKQIMSFPSSYREVRLAHGKLVDRIKNLTQRDWVRVCEKLGLYVPVGAGKGSHCAVYKDSSCPPEDSSCLVVTIPHTLYPNIQRDMVKKIVSYGLQGDKYTEEEVWTALGVKVKKAKS